ncbi:MAG: class I SAM-dependent methyltransferase [Cytophagales bacterium]|nr:MAG: class I SAM-dependent methyltransferase [Cytophagales bacterium]
MTVETKLICQVCQKDKFRTHQQCQDFLVSQNIFKIDECQNCGFRFTNPRPDESTLGDYYKSEQYVSHNDNSGGIINEIYKWVRRYTLGQKLRLINSVGSKRGRLLDVGCGTGLFLDVIKRGGWAIEGVEPDSFARSTAEERLGQQIHETVGQLHKQQFDIITMWHVLEHVPNPHKTIRELRDRLNDNGILLLALPNSESYDAKHYGPHWAAYDVPRHLSHFTPASITRLATEANFKSVTVKPMYFDSFYISMLSTKYRDGKTNLLGSFFGGLKSNFHARRTGNYSSLIYIFQKQ